jgi:hypothetical protein
MDAKRLHRLQGDLTRYLDDVLPDLGRQGRRAWAELYLRGLLLDGRRKSAGAAWTRTCTCRKSRGVTGSGGRWFESSRPEVKKSWCRIDVCHESLAYGGSCMGA